MREPLLIRDRPWSFGTAVALLPVGVGMLVMSFVWTGSPRMDEAAFGARIVALVFLVAGGLLAWHGRRVRLEGGQLRRGGTTERSLAAAGVVCLVPSMLLPEQPDVYLVMTDSEAGRALAELLESGDEASVEAFRVARRAQPSPVERLAYGLRPEASEALAEGAAKQLRVPLVRLAGPA